MKRSHLSWILSAAAIAAACTSPPPAPDASSEGGADVVPMDGTMDAPSCAAGLQLCGARCVDVSASTDHCGACGNACSTTQTCTMGMCVAAIACPSGQTDCGGTCVDTKSSSAHCGECGNACSAGQTCAMGMCALPACTGGETRCAGTCVNTQSDTNNCGACGTVCAMGQMCSAGACVPSTVMCTGTQTNCSGTCVELASDRDNCGACGRTCAPGQSCTASMCTGAIMCNPGQVLCGSTCAVLSSDPMHCGACNMPCVANQRCVAGACVAARPTCPAGQTDCAPSDPTPTCVDLQTSAMNCGACGTSCGAGLTCRAGDCACSGTQTLCGRTCTDTQTDNNNCGACNNACAGGTTCQTGTCRCPSGEGLCGTPAICVNLQSDSANCGTCGAACGGGSSCRAGTCTCPTGLTGCGTPLACVNTQTDRLNCGACGRSCLLGQSCVSGACACPLGQTMCGVGGRARCANLQTDSSNCGACGTVCPAGTSCSAGMCRGVPPVNDARSGAIAISISASAPRSVINADTTSARHDVDGPCGCTTGNDVFYRFTLTQSEIVMASTVGASWDTSLFFLDAAGSAITAPSGFSTCSDDVRECGYTGAGSMIVSKLAAGSYFLVLSGCGAGAAAIEFQHLPAGSGAPVRIAPDASTRTLSPTIAAGTGAIAASCCSSGPEIAHWWLTCPSTAATTFNSSTCSPANGIRTTNYDGSLSQSSALRSTVTTCNDDVGFLCGSGSDLSSTIPATAANQLGLNTLVVDSCIGNGSGTVFYTLANCASGTRCGNACVNTSTDSNNCGGCSRRCAESYRCVAGACVATVANDERSRATTISTTSPWATFNVDTSLARNDTSGTCGCTTGNDVFYRFTLTQTEIVYAHTIGSSVDTSLFFQNAAGANITTAGLTYGLACNDDGGLSGCSTGAQSQVMVKLSAGTYYLVVSGCSAGNVFLHFQHAPAGNGTTTFLPAGSRVVSGTTSGTGTVTGACCSGGPEDTYYWYTCGSFASGTFTASTCGRATWDTELAQVSPRRVTASVCNDDACGPRQSSLSTTIPAGASMHTFYVDGCSTASGAYSVAITRP
ncbi:MAG: MXAN_6577-like cysteine-rich protein [Polyangiales bacterium]